MNKGNKLVEIVPNKNETKLKENKFKKNFEFFAMISPVVLYVFIFNYLPMGGVVLAFKNYNYSDGIFNSPWIGLKNFEFFFKSDIAYRVTFNTIMYNLCFIVVGTIVYIIVALILNEVKNRTAIKFYQTVMFFPYFLSWVVVAFIVYAFLSPAYGIVNTLFSLFGKETQNWYMCPGAWPMIIITAGFWKYMGMSVLINYAVLVSVDKSYYEAAEMDGANKLQCMYHISIPFLIPVTVIQFILAVGRIFNSDFGLFYQLPQNSGVLSKTTEVIDTYVFKSLMELNDVGSGAAIGLYQSIVGLVLVMAANYIVSKIDADNALF